MTVNFSQYTFTPDGGLPTMLTATENLASLMGFTLGERILRYDTASPNILAFTKTNLTGTYSTTYWVFSITTTAVTLTLFTTFNTSTRVGTGSIATYGVRSMTGTLVAGTSYRFDVWKDGDVDVKFGIASCYRVDDNLNFAPPVGWMKFVPFSNFDGNRAATTLMFGTAANITSYLNGVTTGFLPSLGTLDTNGRFGIGYGIYGSGIAARGTDYNFKPTLTAPIIVGQGGVPYGYVDSLDLATFSVNSFSIYTIGDRLMTTDGKLYQPLHAAGHDVFVRVQ